MLSRQADAPGGLPCPRISDVSARLIRRAFPSPPPRFETIHNVMNTYDESRETARLVRTYHWRTVLLVTSATHARRAFLLFGRQGIHVVSVPAPPLPPSPGFVPRVGEHQLVLREVGAYLKDLVCGRL